MTDDERKEKGLVKELKYRYAFASGDFNFLGEKENTNYLRALARLGVRLDDGENDKYFTPESIAEIKKKKKDSLYNTNLVNPIYISDFQAPLEDFEMEIIEGAPKYDEDGNFIGNEPSTEKKKVIRAAERRLTPADVVLGLEGAGGTADTTIPPEGTDNTIKKLEVAFSVSAELTSQNTYTLGVSIVTNPDGTFNKQKTLTNEEFDKVTFTKFNFDPFGYIIVDGIKYSALQVINTSDSKTALQKLRDLDDDDYDRVIDSWGFSETTTQQSQPQGDEEREVPEAEDGEEQLENRTTEELSTTTANSSILEKINLFRGWVVKDGQVQKDKKGNPKTNGDKTPQLRISDSAEVTIDSNGAVSIKGDVTINISNKSDKVKLIENGKFTVPFATIDGNFLCRKLGLTTLTGCPKVVKGTFDCSENSITSLAGSPDEVGIFIATGNKSLASLSGGPKKIIGITTPQKSQTEYIYDVSSCALTSLDGNGITSFGPGGFNCANNKITSLSGLGVVSTTGVTKFDCSKNILTSLVGAPRTIKDTKTGKPGSYNISGNKDITTFPQTMADNEVGEFRASGLSLTSLSFAPKQVYGNFDCSGNTGKKLTNQSIGKDRFKVGGGFEEDAGNRIVKIDGDFITSEGSWKDKTYDSNTVFKASVDVVTVGGPTKKGNDKYDQFNFATIDDTGKTHTDWWGDDTPLAPSKYTVIRAKPIRTSIDVAINGLKPGQADPKSTNCDTYFDQDTWATAHKTFCNLGFWHGASRCPNKTTAFMAMNGVYRGTSDSETYYPVLLVTTSGQAAIKKTSEVRNMPISSIKWACGGSNKLIVGGAATSFGNTHQYATSSRNGNRPRTAAGLTKDGDIIAVITQTACKWNNWKATLKAAGGWDMLNYDGGGSSFATVNGVKTQKSSRPVTTVLVFN